MAYIAASDITVAVLDRGAVGRKRRSYGTVTFNSTALTYTGTTGIPLPTFEKFGFMKQIDMIFFNTVSATTGGFVYKYDPTNKSIRVYSSPAHTVTGTVAAPTFTGVAATPTGTVSAPTFAGTTIAEVTAGTTHAITGTVGSPVFTGIAATPTGTVSAPAFTGTALAIAALAEWTNNVALGAAVTLYFDAIGV